jgi:hypothetical protein
MATCSKCFFTREYTTKFRDWKSDTSFRSYKLKHLKSGHVEALAEEGSFVRMLGDNLDPMRYPLQTAINKLLLGVFDELLSDKPSNMDVARYFIRVGWLFRECGSNDSAAVSSAVSYASNIGEHVRKLSSIYERFEETKLRLKPVLDDHLEHARTTMVDAGAELEERYRQVMTFITGTGDQLESAIAKLDETVRLCSDEEIGSGDDEFAVPYAGHASYRDFLKSVREQWDLAPVSEHDALGLALRFYKQSYEGGHEVSSGNQQIQVEYLIGELSRRLGLADEAKRYFNRTILSAQEFIYKHKGDNARIALARKILEMAQAQGKLAIKKSI